MNSKETTVERQVLIGAPVRTVWKALSTIGLSTLHLLREESDDGWHEGGTIEWYGPEDDLSATPRIKGRITVLAPPRRVAYMAFVPSAGLKDDPENYTLVDITLKEEEDGRTLMTVNHGDFAAHPHGHRWAKQAGDAWVEAMIRLKDRVEHGAAA